MGKHRWKAGEGALKGLACALFLIIPAIAGAQGIESVGAGRPDRSISRLVDRWSPHIREASRRFAVPEDWIRRVMRAESGRRTTVDGTPITSHAGAMGLMQLMPGTWAEMRLSHGLGPDPYDPRDNVLAGAAYLRAMYERFGYPGLFAAYNAGPTRHAEYLATGRRLPAETVAYSAVVGGMPPGRSAAQKQSRNGGVFVALSTARQADTDTLPRPEAPSLFVRLNTASNFARN